MCNEGVVGGKNLVLNHWTLKLSELASVQLSFLIIPKNAAALRFEPARLLTTTTQSYLQEELQKYANCKKIGND